MPEVIEMFRRMRLSETMLAIVHLARRGHCPSAVATMLSDAHNTAPGAVNALLTYPWVGVWAAQCARDPDRHADGLEGVAQAAAIRAGIEERPEWGGLMLPSLGLLDGPAWHPIRTITAGHRGRRISLAVDDVDPYRDCHERPVAARLGEAHLGALAQTLQGAWRLLVQTAPERAEELRAGLVSVVPLRASAAGSLHSVTNSDGFGGFAFTPHHDPAEFAATMVHEFQHSKLSALTSLIPLYDPAHTGTYHAPWRPDPRPLGGLLQGAFAFTAVAAFWHGLRGMPEWEDQAAQRFTELRAQVWQALDGVKGSAGLTDAGHRLVAALTGTMVPLLEV